MKKWVLCLLLMCFSVWAQANDDNSNTAEAAWLDQVAHATQQMDYEGVFVHQRQDKMEISHISHRMDKHVEMARLDTLSGPQRSFLRLKNLVYCYTPDGQHVDIDHRHHHPFFPEILPWPAIQLAKLYQIKPLGHAMVADHDSVGAILLPRDAYRYGYVVWADNASHVLLKIIKLNAHEQPIAQSSFTQVNIGNAPSPELLKTHFTEKELPKAVEAESSTLGQWQVRLAPPGYQSLTATQFDLPGKQQNVVHLVYSDGLSTVSLFIEPINQLNDAPQHGLFEVGVVNMYTRQLGQFQITALGEAPPATLMMMADSLVSTEKK